MNKDRFPDHYRSIFDGVADLYDLARPSYPKELVDDLINLSGANLKWNLLEIGTGPGKLTIALAERGFNITGFEIGTNLAQKARQNLSQLRNAKIVAEDFISYEVLNNSVEMVLAATAYHWLDPERRVRKIADILKPGGIIAIIDTHHIDGGKDTFPATSQKCYCQWDPNTTEDYAFPVKEDIENRQSRWENELVGKFKPLFRGTYVKDISYTGAEYARLLQTYSDVAAMTEANREGLIACLESLINSDYGGMIVKSYLWELYLAVKR